MTQERIWLVFAVIAGVSFAVQVSLPIDLNDRPETTFDTAPRGHVGVFTLLDRFDATPGRWLSGVTRPPTTDTIWWIAPLGACGVARTEQASGSSSNDEAADAPRRSPFEITVRPWIEAGGTALVWLSHPPMPEVGQAITDDDLESRTESEALDTEEGLEETDALSARKRWEEELATSKEMIHHGVARDCDAILGFALPSRALAGLEGGMPPVEGRSSPIAFSVGRATERHEDFDYAKTRILPGSTLGFFQTPRGPSARQTGVPDELDEIEEGDDGRARSKGWRALWVEANEAMPLALERSLGEGRLVVIADARILSNDRLGHGDSAPFIFDWVRDYGRPWIDEHAHGIVPEPGTFRYLARSPAWAAGLGLIVLGALVVWRGNAWPTRKVSEFDPESPTLATFVDSVARLYCGTQDHARVFDRYRLICLDRIRRALGLAPGTNVEIVLASLRARAGNWPELEETGLRHLLIKQISISDESDLARNVARLDDLVRVLRESGKREKREASPVEATTRTN